MKGKEYRFIKEYKTPDEPNLKVGDEINTSVFAEGDIVKVSGMSKGKGFQGGVKRHGFKTRIKTHGQKHQLRASGSKGTRFPQHVRKGLRMAGHMGVEQVTVKNLQVVEVDVKKNLISVKGAVPGHRNGLVKIISTGKIKPLVKLVEVKEEKKKK